MSYKVEKQGVDIQNYYESLLKQLGWTLSIADKTPGYVYVWMYYSDETCLWVTTYRDNNKKYKILVYHDFVKQDFSPELPPLWFIKARILRYDVQVVSCPPE